MNQSICVPSIAAIWAVRYRLLMRLWVLLFIIVITACDAFLGSASRPKSELTPQEFVDVYVALTKARTPGERQRVLKQHKTSEKALHEFVQAYSRDLPKLSATFDSALAKMSSARLDDARRQRR